MTTSPGSATQHPGNVGNVGTVTFVFTDLEGSTRLLDLLRNDYSAVLEDYYAIVGAASRETGGEEIDRAGDGLFYSFPSARGAVMAAIEIQRALASHEWPRGAEVRARMGLHTGEPMRGAAGYVGMDVHRAARIAACGHGGQILLSQSSRELVSGELGEHARLLDLGEHWLKDLTEAEHLYQVVADGLQSNFPPLRSLATLPNNLPRNLSTFVGRRHELDEARDLLNEAPLVTLTGPGGVGKTRLAVQLAAELIDRFTDGAWLVELETLSDPDLVPQTVAAALGVTDVAEVDQTVALSRHLKAYEALIILDNCEQILDACARLANTLLRSCPGLRILATSREALGVPGERLYPVRSLTLPDEAGESRLDEITEFESVTLFVERARAVDPTFQLTNANANSVVEICRRLDGIPLAIELAAARVRSLTLDQIASRLDDRFRLLTGGSRTVLPRHQTLRAAMDWSISLLAEGERLVLWRLSVFSGGFSLEAAESVCAGGEVDELDVVDHVSRLVEKSLVIRHESGYRLLETVREFAREQLVASGDAGAAHGRHLDWYIGLVKKAGPTFFGGPESAEWVDRFERDHENLRTALGWSLGEQGDGRAALVLAGGMWRFWEIRGYLAEGRSWLERVLERTSGQMSAQRAEVMTGAGVLAAGQGDHAASVRFHEQALAMQQELGNRQAMTYAMHNLANAAMHHGDLDRARELYEETARRTRDLRDVLGLPISLLNVAEVADRQRDYAAAEERYQEAIDLIRAQGDQWTLGYALGNYGESAARQGDAAKATEMYEQAARIYSEIGDKRGEARILTLKAELASQADDQRGARQLLHSALEIRCQLGDTPQICAALERMAGAAADDQADVATRIVGAASAMRDKVGARPSMTAQAELEQVIAGLQERLGQEAFTTSWQRGRQSSLETALADAAEVAAG